MGVEEIFKLTDLFTKIHKYSPSPCSIPQEANCHLDLSRPTVLKPVVEVYIHPLSNPPSLTAHPHQAQVAVIIAFSFMEAAHTPTSFLQVFSGLVSPN